MSLDHLRRAVTANPDLALRYPHRHPLRKPAINGILVTEAYLCAGEGDNAADAAVEALAVVTADPYRLMLLPAMAVPG